METQSLFLDKKLSFLGTEKVAGMLTKLNDNSEMWAQEISREAYNRLPYLSNYEASVVLDKVDDERGYAFGSIEVQPRSDMGTSEAKKSGLKKAHIPIIIKNNMLYPFDVLMSGKDYKYLTEDNLNKCLFRPETFDAVRDRPAEYGLANDLLPPSMSAAAGYGLGGMKYAEAVPILPQLDGRILQEHKDRFISEMSDPDVKVAYANAHDAVKAAALSAARLDPTNLEKSASAAWAHVNPDVVQLKKLNTGNYLVKWANTGMFSPEEDVVGPEAAAALVENTGMAEPLAAGQTVTANPAAVVQATLAAEGIKPVDSFGIWTVQDKNGNSLTGWAFPNVMTLDMQPMTLTLFTNGSIYALQGCVVGKMVGKSNDIPRGAPKGHGCLYFKGQGGAQAFMPMTISNTYTGPDGRVKFVGEKETGEPVTISFSEDVRQISKVAEGEYLVPSTHTWMPLTERAELIEDPGMFMKTANKDWVGTVELLGDKDVFSYRGAPLAKVAEEHYKFVDRDQAEFIGVALGMRPDFVKEALDRASRGENVIVTSLRPLGGPTEKLAEYRTQIKNYIENLDYPIKNYSLVKEASVLSDAMTADKILGLGFINAENVATFVEMIPGLEAASAKIAELLIASRLGLEDVPEAALERMLVATEDVIKGLRSLHQKEVTFAE